jgi:FtsH-binding integral membrane protein
MNIDDLEKRDQMNFVRKVYMILAAQLSITTLFIIAVQTVD